MRLSQEQDASEPAAHAQAGVRAGRQPELAGPHASPRTGSLPGQRAHQRGVSLAQQEPESPWSSRGGSALPQGGSSRRSWACPVGTLLDSSGGGPGSLLCLCKLWPSCTFSLTSYGLSPFSL